MGRVKHGAEEVMRNVSVDGLTVCTLERRTVAVDVKHISLEKERLCKSVCVNFS